MKKNEIVIYEKPTCTKCRQANAVLAQQDIPVRRVNYYESALTQKKLKELLRKMNLSAKEILRDTEPVYRELGLAKRKDQMSDDELIALMIQYPDLMQRPIVEHGDEAVLARPVENLDKLL